jgi:transposase
MDDYNGGSSYLTSVQQEELKEYLSKNLFRTAAEIVEYIKSEYHVEYTVGSIRHLLKRLGFGLQEAKIDSR